MEAQAESQTEQQPEFKIPEGMKEVTLTCPDCQMQGKAIAPVDKADSIEVRCQSCQLVRTHTLTNGMIETLLKEPDPRLALKNLALRIMFVYRKSRFPEDLSEFASHAENLSKMSIQDFLKMEKSMNSWGQTVIGVNVSTLPGQKPQPKPANPSAGPAINIPAHLAK